MSIRRQISELKVILMCSQVSTIDVTIESNYQVLKLSSGENVLVVLVLCFSSLFNLYSSLFQCRQQLQCLRNPLTPQQREEKRWHYHAGPQALLSLPSPGTGRLSIHVPCLVSISNSGKSICNLTTLSKRKALFLDLIQK